MLCCGTFADIKRVALLDFDVHHGNGTEACVAATAPSLLSLDAGLYPRVAFSWILACNHNC